MLILTPDEIRKAEETANRNSLSYEDMMESAGVGCAEHIIKNYPESKNAVIICGKGKNGGDGFVIARCLSEWGMNVSVILAFNSPSDSLSEKNKKKIYGSVNIYDGTRLSDALKSLLKEADIIADAVFGIGFKGSLPVNVKDMFSFIRDTKAVKIAIDIPSGLSENNENNEGCFIADETLSMLCFKPLHVYKPYSSLCGRVSVIPIGFGVFGAFPYSCTMEEIREMLPLRPFDGNKGTFGKALIIAGSCNMPGAGIIATRGCLSSGAGLTCFCFPDKIYQTVTAALNECVFMPVSTGEKGGFCPSSFDMLRERLHSFDAVALGPGLGTEKETEEFVKKVIKSYKGKLIIDADGINIISRNIDILKESQADIVMTPHPGEFSRLTGISADEINSRREEVARDFAVKHKVTLLLKGANTVIAHKDGRVYINPTGCVALARGGSGDLLTGLIASFTAQGNDVASGAILGAYIHGLAGEKAEEKYTSYASTVEKITGCVGEALSEIIRGK